MIIPTLKYCYMFSLAIPHSHGILAKGLSVPKFIPGDKGKIVNNDVKEKN